MITINIKKTKENIYNKMQELKYTQVSLAKEMNLTNTAVYRWVSFGNSQLPSLENLFMLADIFHCSVEDIIAVERK